MEFTHRVSQAVLAKNYTAAAVAMRDAPRELGLLLADEPTSILHSLFRFLASVLRHVALADAGARQFLRVLRALLRYGATCLDRDTAPASRPCADGYARGHPLRAVLASLARVGDGDMLPVARRAWLMGCRTGLGLMDEPASVVANLDLLGIVTQGGARVSDLPADFDSILQRTIRHYSTRETRGLRLISVMNRALYLQKVVQEEGRHVSRDAALTEAYWDAEEEIYSIVSFGQPPHGHLFRRLTLWASRIAKSPCNLSSSSTFPH